MVKPLATRGRIAPLLALAAAISLLASCSKPAYWVEGLSLPPGSTVVDELETGTPREVPGIALPMMGEFSQSLTVAFNNYGGWNAVSLHIDRCLQDQGYSEGLGSLDDMIASMPGTGGSVARMSKYLRMYSKRGAKYMVVLYSVEDMAEETGSTAGAGEFVLQVMKFRR
jgi:hypothetical protein